MLSSILPFLSTRRYEHTGEILGKAVVGVTRLKDKKALACKTIIVPDKKEKRRVEEEFKRLHKVYHPHIVRYYDFDIEVTKRKQILAYLYMERCTSGTLDKYIKMQSGRIAASRTKPEEATEFVTARADSDISTRRRDESRQHFVPIGGAGLDEKLLWNWIKQIASVLVYCHYRIIHLDDQDIHVSTASDRILHRDLKPDNIFLSVDEGAADVIVKVGDFGHSVELDQSNPAYVTHKNGDYVAPEIREGDDQVPWTVACDIYSFGCIVYFMCSGVHPDWLCDKTREFIISGLPSDYSLSLRSFVADCCPRKPESRPDACELYNRAWRAYNECCDL